MRRQFHKAWPAVKCWLEALLSFFYPEVCQYCGHERATATDGFVGANCRKNIKIIVPPYCERCGLPFEGELTSEFFCANCRGRKWAFSAARSAVVAEGMIRDLLHRYKYHRALWVEPFLASLLIAESKASLPAGQWDMIVPIPLHLKKEQEREFNQADRLARRLSRAAGLPVRSRVLRRVKPTQSQTHLTREERANNVRHAFTMGETGGLDRKRIVLVDDVFTTGATTSTCAGLLKKAGASEVCVWTVARGMLN